MLDEDEDPGLGAGLHGRYPVSRSTFVADRLMRGTSSGWPIHHELPEARQVASVALSDQGSPQDGSTHAMGRTMLAYLCVLRASAEAEDAAAAELLDAAYALSGDDLTRQHAETLRGLARRYRVSAIEMRAQSVALCAQSRQRLRNVPEHP